MKPQSFGQMIFDEYTALSSFAFKFTRDSDDAKDLLQETMLRALSHADNYMHGANLKGWLYSIMKNTFINDYRKSLKVQIVSGHHQQSHCSALLSCATRNTSENFFLKEDIQRALDRLPYIYSEPFIAHFQGFKYEEIAFTLSVPVGTVKRRIHCARKSLKSMLSEHR